MLPKVTNEINTSSEDVIKLHETNSCKIQRLIFFLIKMSLNVTYNDKNTLTMSIKHD